MSITEPRTRIVIMAKAPIPGQVKTRLIPALGANGAAQLAARLFHHAVGVAAEVPDVQIEVCASPHRYHPAFCDLACPEGVRWADQVIGDLGERMGDAVRRGTDDGYRVILTGTDCPALTSDVLSNVSAALDDVDVCMVPATDGGYVALGVSGNYQRLFTKMPWSTADVSRVTLERCRDLHLRTSVYEPLPDIDVPDDLVHLPAALTIGES